MSRFRLIYLFVLLFGMLSPLNSIGQNASLFSQLNDVNVFWSQQNGLDKSFEDSVVFTSDQELIQRHLFLVHQILKEKPTAHLDSQQRVMRSSVLDYLIDYQLRGVFPQNIGHAERTPYFIDHRKVACAVGHLLIKTGYGDLASQISNENNNGYLMELAEIYPQIESWSDNYGFELEELAWVQPSYPLEPSCDSVNYVNEFYVDLLYSLKEDDHYFYWHHLDSNKVIYGIDLPLASTGNTYVAYAINHLTGDTISPDSMLITTGSRYVRGNTLYIEPPVPLKYSLSLKDDPGNCMGSAEFTLLSSVPLIHFTWGKCSVKEMRCDSLCAGEYKFKVYDQRECATTVNFTIGWDGTKLDKPSGILVMGNPVKGDLNLKIDAAKWSGGRLFVVNSVGIEVFSETITKNSIHVENLEGGWFQVCLQKDAKMERKSIVVN